MGVNPRDGAGGDTRSDVTDETLPGDDSGAIPIDVQVGAVLGGRYQIEGELGRGGEGVVFRALDRVANEPVAIKLIGAPNSPEGLERVRRQLKLARRVTHPGVVRIHDLIELGGPLALSMELVDGSTLSARLEGGSPFPKADWIALAADVIRALAAAHRAGVVHRDLKPANIMLRASNGRAVITDFGVSRLGSGPAPHGAGSSSGSLELTREGAIEGTPLYMAPEQLSGKSDIGPPADIYAFGVILYEAATGTRPHLGETLDELLEARRTRVTPLASLRSDLPPELCRLIDRCLDPDPSLRPQDGAALRVAFDAGLPKRRLWGGWIAGAIALAVLGVALLRFDTHRPAAPPIIDRISNEEESLERFSISPDGSKLAIGSTRGGSWDLWLLDLASGNWRQLTHDPAVDQAPQFTDDGRALLFFSIRDKRGLYRISLDGGEPEFLLEMEWFASAAAGKVAYLRRMHDVALFDLASRESQDVLHIDSSEELGDVTLSPDGKRLAYNLHLPTDFGRDPLHAFVVDLTTGKKVALGEGVRGSLAFVDDNQLVASRGKNLWRLFLDGRAAEQITSGAGPDSDPVLGRDHKLYYLQTSTSTQLFRRAPGGAWERVTHDRRSYALSGIDGDGRLLTIRHESLAPAGTLSWQPGGDLNEMGQVASAALGPDLVVAESVDGSHDRLRRYRHGKLDGELSLPASCRGPTVSADGKIVAWASLEEGLVSWQSERRQLSSEGGCSARFSPKRASDLAWVRRLPGDSGELMLRDVASGKERAITRLPTRRTAFAWEPDGDAIVFHDGGRGRLVRVELASGARSDVADRPTSWLWDLVIGPDGTLYASAQLDRDALLVVRNF
jgi:serine/threonine protein kinase